MSIKRIAVSCAPLYNVPQHGAELESQCLLGEQFDVNSTEGDFVHGTLLTDNYRGWVPASALADMQEPTHRLIAPCSWLRSDRDIKSTSLMAVYAGSLLCVNANDDESGEVMLNGAKGFLPSAHIMSLESAGEPGDWVAVAEQFTGVPYVWGGRTFSGLDCSALVQLAAQTAGNALPRNSSQQKLCGDVVDSVSLLQRGDLVFWKGHVGIMQSDEQLLHANAYHMQVISEPVQDAITRIANIAGPVTALKRLI